MPTPCVAAAKMVLVDNPAPRLMRVAALFTAGEGTALAWRSRSRPAARDGRSGALQKLAESANDEIPWRRSRRGDDGRLDDLPALLRRLVGAKARPSRKAVKAAIKASGIRMPDVDACAEKLPLHVRAPAMSRCFC